jgi:hypothetical protein
MKKLFPNIETAIIFVFVICVMLWGVTRCNRKKEDMTIKAVTEGAVLSTAADSVASVAASPAARREANRPAATVPPPPTVDPNQGMVASTPPQYQQAPTVQNPTQSVQSPAVSTTKPPTIGHTTLTPGKPTVPTPPTVQEPSGTLLYVLINGLNVRSKPDLKAKSLGKLKLNDQVYFLNEVTPEAQTVRLIDKSEVTKPWFKIKTKRGTVGWVHGSGVDFYKRKPQGVL